MWKSECAKREKLSIESKKSAFTLNYLIIIQRGVVTQSTDGSQLNQPIILATFH